MLLKIRSAHGRQAPAALVKHLIRAWRRSIRGYLTREVPRIYQDREAKRILNIRNASACCLGTATILCRSRPSVSTVCEELIHVLQFDCGMYNSVAVDFGNVFASYLMERLAATILVANGQVWRIGAREQLENRRRAIVFTRIIRAEIGGIPWRTRLKLRASASSLARTLESWMGSYLMGR